MLSTPGRIHWISVVEEINGLADSRLQKWGRGLPII